MTEKYSFKAYLALFNLLDLKFEKSKDSQLGRLLGDMNPNLFADDTSADSACFEDFLDCSASYTSDEVLNAYLADINEQAEDMFFRLVKQLAEKEGVTEKLKADNQMLWVARMNNIRNRATEIVNTELIYT